MGRSTDSWKWFMGELVKLEPGTENSGIYTYKPGYHASRADNIAMDKTDSSSVADYSIRDAVDQLGPSDAGAAGDWTHRNAQSGNYASMAKYGNRLKAAFDVKDPRLNGWREALGQTDLDKTPEGLDFRYWTLRTPDSTHEWHWHFSESRAYAESYDNKRAMLSVLRGETLSQYLLAGGVLLSKDGKGPIQVSIKNDPDAWAEANRVWAMHQMYTAYSYVLTYPDGHKETRQEVCKLSVAINAITAALAESKTREEAMLAAIGKLAEGGQNIDTAVIIGAVNEAAAKTNSMVQALQEDVDRLEAEKLELQAKLSDALKPTP